jgi:uncharacterized protein YoxC
MRGELAHATSKLHKVQESLKGDMQSKHETMVRHTSQLAKEMANIADACHQLDENGTSGHASLSKLCTSVTKEHEQTAAKVAMLADSLADLEAQVTVGHKEARANQECVTGLSAR